MKRTNKKGFTTVELVIVIAVIAILAAVLIPTFASLIKKANISADTQLAKNLNTAIAMESATGDKVDEFAEVLTAARNAGYVISNLNPTTDGCFFVWESKTNQILLVDGEDDYKVLYAANKNYEPIGDTWYFAIADKNSAEKVKADLASNNVNVKNMVATVEALKEALSVGGEFYLDDSVSVAESHIFGKEGVATVVNLGTSRINTDGVLDNAVPVIVDNKGEVTFNGGVITGIGTFVETDGDVVTGSFLTEPGTKTTLNGTVFGASDGIGKVIFGGDATLNDVEVTSSNIGIDITEKAQVVMNDTKITVNGGRGICLYICDSHSGTTRSNVTINSGTYTGKGTGAVISLCGGDAVINGGTFNSNGTGKLFGYGWNNATATDSTITITGGTFNGKSFAQLMAGGEDAWNALCDNLSKATISGNTVIISKK